jgi:hypothetical protein
LNDGVDLAGHVVDWGSSSECACAAGRSCSTDAETLRQTYGLHVLKSERLGGICALWGGLTTRLKQDRVVWAGDVRKQWMGRVCRGKVYTLVVELDGESIVSCTITHIDRIMLGL